MFDFKYFAPTRVLFGRGVELKVAEMIRMFGGTKVLIHYGGGSVIRSGLMQRVTDTLDAAGIAWVKLGGAVPNPRLSLVYQGIKLCRAEGVDFLAVFLDFLLAIIQSLLALFYHLQFLVGLVEGPLDIALTLVQLLLALL